VLLWNDEWPAEHRRSHGGRPDSALCRRRPSIRPLFDVVERPLDSHTRLLAPIGDLDAATNPAFRDAMRAAAAHRGERLVLDLSEVSFMSAGAIGVIARERTRVERGQGQLLVICPSARLRRLFEIVGLDSVLDIVASREAISA
jgi:anti-sigma B factor antagonist